MRTFDEILAEEEARDRDAAQVAPSKPEPMRTVPPKDVAGLQARIKAGESPLPGGLHSAWEAIKESNQVVGENLANRTLAGVPSRVLGLAESVAPEWWKSDRAQPLPERGKSGRGIADRPEDFLPGESTLSSVPAAALDTAAVGGIMGKAGEAIAQGPRMLAAKFGATEAQQVVRPAVQTAANAAGAGLGYGAADAALRGGDLGEVVEGGLSGAAGNAMMSHLPAVAGAIESRMNQATAGRCDIIAFPAAPESRMNQAIINRAVKPLLGIGQGKSANKAQLALGKGDKVAGKEEMKKVLVEEGLEPTIRKDRANIANVVAEKKEQVWEELGPIRAIAYEAEPSASVPMHEVKKALYESMPAHRKGTDFHDDMDKAWKMLQDRAKRIGSPLSFPVRNLFENARAMESLGYNRTEASFANGESARNIGKILRDLVDMRISKVYVKHPELAKKAMGFPVEDASERVLSTGEINPEYTEAQAAAKIAKKSGEPDLAVDALGDKYLDMKRRYSRLSAIEPAAEQLASRSSQERPGLINSMMGGGRRLFGGMVGGAAGGAPGVLAGAAIADLAGRSVSPFQRATGAVASRLAGPAVDPQLSGAILARFGQEGLDAYETYLANKNAKGASK
jgi:hypothetical protein